MSKHPWMDLPHSDDVLHESDDAGRHKQSANDLTLAHVILTHAHGWGKQDGDGERRHEHRHIVLK